MISALRQLHQTLCWASNFESHRRSNASIGGRAPNVWAVWSPTSTRSPLANGRCFIRNEVLAAWALSVYCWHSKLLEIRAHSQRLLFASKFKLIVPYYSRFFPFVVLLTYLKMPETLRCLPGSYSSPTKANIAAVRSLTKQKIRLILGFQTSWPMQT